MGLTTRKPLLQWQRAHHWVILSCSSIKSPVVGSAKCLPLRRLRWGVYGYSLRFLISVYCRKVCKFKKSIDPISYSVVRFGYSHSIVDHTMFTKWPNGKITILIVYIDDIVVTGDDIKWDKQTESLLSKGIWDKDLGQLSSWMKLLCQVRASLFRKGNMFLIFLRKTSMLGCGPAETPIEVYHQLRSVVLGGFGRCWEVLETSGCTNNLLHA